MAPAAYDPIGTVQQAIASLLLAHEPQFIAIGLRLFLSCATMTRPTLGEEVAGPVGTARAGSGGLCLRRPAACALTEEVDPCPHTCTFLSKTMTRSWC